MILAFSAATRAQSNVSKRKQEIHPYEMTSNETDGSVGSNAMRWEVSLRADVLPPPLSVWLTEKREPGCWCAAKTQAASLLIPPSATSTRKKFSNWSHPPLYSGKITDPKHRVGVTHNTYAFVHVLIHIYFTKPPQIRGGWDGSLIQE